MCEILDSIVESICQHITTSVRDIKTLPYSTNQIKGRHIYLTTDELCVKRKNRIESTDVTWKKASGYIGSISFSRHITIIENVDTVISFDYEDPLLLEKMTAEINRIIQVSYAQEIDPA